MLASAALPPLGFTVLIFALALPFLHTSQCISAAAGGVFARLGDRVWLVFHFSLVDQQGLCHLRQAHVFLIPLVALGLPLFLGLFWGAAFWLAFVAATSPVARVVLLVALLSLAEYTRGFVLTGFPWNAPGMIFANADLTITAATFGLWGLSLIALLIPLVLVLVMLGQQQAVAWRHAYFCDGAGGDAGRSQDQ